LVGLGIAYIVILIFGFNKYLNKVEAENSHEEELSA